MVRIINLFNLFPAQYHPLSWKKIPQELFCPLKLATRTELSVINIGDEQVSTDIGLSYFFKVVGRRVLYKTANQIS